jgi:hypothetical protein
MRVSVNYKMCKELFIRIYQATNSRPYFWQFHVFQRAYMKDYLPYSCFVKIVIFVLSAQNDCFLLGHENEFLVETVRSRLQTYSNVKRNASTSKTPCIYRVIQIGIRAPISFLL